MITIAQNQIPIVTSLKIGVVLAVFFQKLSMFIRANWIWCIGALLLLFFIGYNINNHYQKAKRKKEELRK
jgi:hypothetical protein